MDAEESTFFCAVVMGVYELHGNLLSRLCKVVLVGMRLCYLCVCQSETTQ